MSDRGRPVRGRGASRNAESSRGGKSKGPGGGGGGGGGGGRSVYMSKRPVGGRGIFVTCVRGKESRAAGEMYDLLDEVADVLYPPKRMEQIKLEFPHKFPSATATATAAEEPAKEAATDAPAAVESESDSDEDESIEASIARELAVLKSKNKKPRFLGPDGKPLTKAKPPKPRFQSLETKTECLVFIAVAFPYDPLELVYGIVKMVRETGVSKTRYIQRLEPVALSTSSLSLDILTEASTRLVEKTFHQFAKREGRTEITYQIEPSLRNHTEPLNRQVLIDILGTAVRSLSSPPTTTTSQESTAPGDTSAAVDAALAESDLTRSSVKDRPLLKVSANLKTPDLVLAPVVLKNTYSLGIVEGSVWSGPLGRKFNLEAIAQEVRRREIDQRGETAVRGVEVGGKKEEEIVAEP